MQTTPQTWNTNLYIVMPTITRLYSYFMILILATHIACAYKGFFLFVKMREKNGFRSRKWAPEIAELTKFEEDTAKLIECINSRKVSDSFQTKLHEYIESIFQSSSLLILAHKTRSIYSLATITYRNYCQSNFDTLYPTPIPRHYKQH